MERVIFLICLIVLIPLASSLTEKEICFQVYSFIINSQGNYNFIDIQNLNQEIGVNNSESYILDFNNKCLNYFNGVLDKSFVTAYSNYNQTCQVNLQGFFESSFKINTSIYIGDFDCNTHHWLDYFIQIDDKMLTGIRFWLVIPLILIILMVVWGIRHRKSR